MFVDDVATHRAACVFSFQPLIKDQPKTPGMMPKSIPHANSSLHVQPIGTELGVVQYHCKFGRSMLKLWRQPIKSSKLDTRTAGALCRSHLRESVLSPEPLYNIYIYIYIHTHLNLQNPAKFPPFARKIGFPKEQPFFAERRFLIVPNNLILQRRHCPTKRRQYPTKRWHYPTTWGDIFFKRRFSAFEFTRTTRNSVFWSNGEKCTTWKM